VLKRVELQDGYSVVVENDPEKQETTMGIEGWQLMFLSKQDVLSHIALLTKALEFWQYE